MLTYYEERRRVKRDFGNLYKVRSWYLFGVLIYRRWEQLTTDLPTPEERT